jgi:hypothetical protein
MGDTEFSNRIVTTRKPHRCFGCCGEIPVGAKASYSTGVYDGYFFASYFCSACVEWLAEHPGYFEDGICEGDINTAREEVQDE